MTVPARIDADRTATGKTILTSRVSYGREGTCWAPPGEFHIDVETGRRTVLVPQHPYPLARCDKHLEHPEVNEGCGTITCQECIRLVRGDS